MDYINFEIVGQIMTKQRPRASVIGGYAHIYTPKSTLNYENYVRECYLNAVEDFPKEQQTFGDKPLRVLIYAHFKAPKKYEKYGDNIQGLFCDKNKDLDNIAKIVLDSLNKVAYNDDKQVIDLSLAKMWTNKQEKVIVKIETCAGIYVWEQFKEVNKPERKKKCLEK